MSNISKIKISGTSYDIKDENACKVVELTQAQYDALPASAKTSNSLFVITDATAGDLTNYYTKSETDDLLDTKLDASAYTPTDLSNYYTKSETSGATEISTALSSKADAATTYTKTETDNAITAATATKQDTLVSGTNIKTINNESILGSGNIDIQGGGSSYTAGRGIDITNDTISVSLPISAGTGSGSIICGRNNNKASGSYSFAGGEASSATSFWSFAYGANCKSGYGAWAGGFQCQANGSYSFAIGEKTRTSNNSECSIGHYNVTNTSSTNDLKTLFSVGNGTADNARHNAFEIRQNGDIYLTLDGTNDVKLQDTITATAANTTALGGLKLVKLSQSEYDSLSTKDNSTLYVIVN